MAKDKKQDAYLNLLELAAKQGYVTFDNIFYAAEKWHLPLNDVDWLSNSISTIGILVYDKPPHLSTYEVNVDDDDEFNDYAQSDYDELYENAVKLEPSLEPVVNDIRHIRPAQYKEISRLVLQAKEGNLHARDRLIEMHLRAALRIAYQRAMLFDEDITDCFGNACIGIVTAIDKYDPHRNGALGSYISMWVLQTMMREQPTKCNLYVPAHKRELFFLVYPILKDYGCTECDKLFECKKARDIIKNKLGTFSEENEITDIIIQSSTFKSLEEIAESGKDIDALYFDYEYYENNSDSLAITNERKETIYRIINNLPERERYVIIRRFGFYNIEPMTLEEVSKEIGVTRERVRQIEAKALRTIYNSKDYRRIYDGDFSFRKYPPVKGGINSNISTVSKTPIAEAFAPSRFGLFLAYCYKCNVIYVEDLSKEIIDVFLSIVGDSKPFKYDMVKILTKFKMMHLIA